VSSPRRALLVVVATIAAIGSILAALAQPRLDTDVFSLLPDGIPVIEGLRLEQEGFGGSRELIAVVRSADPASTDAAAEAFANRIEAAELGARVVRDNPLRADRGAAAEVIAHLWLNAEPARFRLLARRLEPAVATATFAAAQARMAHSLDTAEVARLGRDPLELGAILADIEAAAGNGAPAAFESADGRLRIVVVEQPAAVEGFFALRAWVDDVGAIAAAVEARRASGDGPAVDLTGYPALVVEAGSGLLGDVLLAALGTLVLVGLLFALAYRRWQPVAWLLALLLAAVVLTFLLAALLLGPLFAVSFAFAAILLGLAADYGLILYQESVAGPGSGPRAHRRNVAPSILWAAGTTAVAFAMLGFSSLPGVRQLGLVVAIGLVVVAVLMLLALLPPLARVGLAARGQARGPGAITGERAVWPLTGGLAAVALGVVALQPPGIDAGTRDLGPRSGEAQALLEQTRAALGGESAGTRLVVRGPDVAAVRDRLEALDERLRQLSQRGLAGHHVLPLAIWPDAERLAQNRPVARELAADAELLLRVGREAGFSASGLALTREVIDHWRRMAERDALLPPRTDAAAWLLRHFASRDADGRWLAAGHVEIDGGAGNDGGQALAAELGAGDGVWIADWSLATGALVQAMRADLFRVLLPVALVLPLMLFAVFRSGVEVALGLGLLGLTMLLLNAAMGLLGWQWNLVNMMALPLLLGAAVDYAIHIQLALRRFAGDRSRMHATVGRAVGLCGASTAIGFAMLGLASNAGVASLGRVAALGIVIAMLVALFCLPVWWRTLRHRRADATGANR